VSSKFAVLDTVAYSHIERNNPKLIMLLSSYERLILPLNVLAELQSGFRLGTKEKENLHTLNIFIAKPQVGIVLPDEATLEPYILLHTHAKTRHYTLSHNDLWIAALAEQFQYDLVTFDKDFAVFTNLFKDRLHILDTQN